MPFSRSDNAQPITDLVDLENKNKPGSLKLLDVGPGWGKWGFLMRGLLDAVVVGHDKEKWQHRIDALEIFPEYITPMHEYMYNNIYEGDFREFFKSDEMGFYDVIIMGDVLEHVTLEEGKQAIKDVSKKCTSLIISAPAFKDEQGEVLGNPHETHKAWWTEKDFKSVHGLQYLQKHGMLWTAKYTFMGF